MREFLNLANSFRSTSVLGDDFLEVRHRFESALKNLLDTLPKVVCLCGSTRYYEEFQRANFRETMAGNIVLTVGFYPHGADWELNYQCHGEDVGVSPEEKIALDELHKRKIDLADEILVLNVGGYVGQSTASEIAYAQANSKPVRWLETPAV